MSPRDQLIETLQVTVGEVGIIDTAEKGIKVAILNNVIKRLAAGQSKFVIMKWMNAAHRTLDVDVKHVAQEVYETYLKEKTW